MTDAPGEKSLPELSISNAADWAGILSELTRIKSILSRNDNPKEVGEAIDALLPFLRSTSEAFEVQTTTATAPLKLTGPSIAPEGADPAKATQIPVAKGGYVNLADIANALTALASQTRLGHAETKTSLGIALAKIEGTQTTVGQILEIAKRIEQSQRENHKDITAKIDANHKATMAAIENIQIPERRGLGLFRAIFLSVSVAITSVYFSDKIKGWGHDIKDAASEYVPALAK